MDNLEGGGVWMDNLGEKMGGRQNIYSCYAEATGDGGGGCPSDVGASVRNPAAGWGLHLA